MTTQQPARWTEDGRAHSARWRSESGARLPARLVPADDRLSADRAFTLVCEGTGLVWRGDFHQARQLLQALARRVERKPPKPGAEPRETFHRARQWQSRRAWLLGMLLVPLEAGPEGYAVPLRRAPAVHEACVQAYGPAPAGAERSLVALRELNAVLSAHQWQLRGVPVPALGGERVHPRYGVFSPVRGEYVDLVARAADGQVPSRELAFDIGTGTGVLSAVLARRGVARVVATDTDERALDCARENVSRLRVDDAVEVVRADLFPPGRTRAPLVVCNPPWVPAKPSAPVERAVYDHGSRMLHGFLDGLAERLAPGGEGWLVLSDLAEHLGLRTREELLDRIASSGLRVLGRLDARPRHQKAADAGDPLHAARDAEVTSLWRLGGHG